MVLCQVVDVLGGTLEITQGQRHTVLARLQGKVSDQTQHELKLVDRELSLDQHVD